MAGQNQLVASEEDGAHGISNGGKTVVITQSDYIPWKGYFDLIASSDECILYDDVQFTRRDWRNRNRIKTPQGLKWLTIPVQNRGRYFQRIDEVMPAGDEWIEDHWKTLEMAYGRAAHFAEFAPDIRSCFDAARGTSLSFINRTFIERICRMLGIRTVFRWSSEFEAHGVKTERLITICNQTGATEYLSGPSAGAYLEEEQFIAHGMTLRYFDYTGYAQYPQLYPPFEHGVSILDLLFNAGGEAAGFLKKRTWKQ